MKKLFTPTDKTNVTIAAIKGEQSNAQIASKYEVHPIQIGKWKKQAIQILKDGFSDKRKKKAEEQQDQLDELHKLLGKKDVEIEWLKKKISLVDSP